MTDYDIKLFLLKLSFNKSDWFVGINLRKGKPLARYKNELTINLGGYREHRCLYFIGVSK